MGFDRYSYVSGSSFLQTPFVRSKDKHYGLTIGHVFGDSSSLIAEDDIDLPSEFRDNNPEFSFDRDDEEDHGEIEMSDIAVTSLGM